MRGSNYVQGKFHPQNPNKYRGDISQVIYRSSWELAMFRWADQEETILAWSSEETVIPYISAVDGKKHRYFLDMTLWVKTPRGVEKKFVEIKPEEQTKKPVKRATEKDQAFAERVRTYLTNISKWTAAKEYAQANGGDFIVITEKQLFPSNHSLKRYRQPKKK